MAKETFLNLPDVTCIQETEARKQNSHHSLNTRKHRKARNDKGKKVIQRVLEMREKENQTIIPGGERQRH